MSLGRWSRDRLRVAADRLADAGRRTEAAAMRLRAAVPRSLRPRGRRLYFSVRDSRGRLWEWTENARHPAWRVAAGWTPAAPPSPPEDVLAAVEAEVAALEAGYQCRTGRGE